MRLLLGAEWRSCEGDVGLERGQDGHGGEGGGAPLHSFGRPLPGRAAGLLTEPPRSLRHRHGCGRRDPCVSPSYAWAAALLGAPDLHTCLSQQSLHVYTTLSARLASSCILSLALALDSVSFGCLFLACFCLHHLFYYSLADTVSWLLHIKL